MRVQTASAGLYDRLERAIIALEYALADDGIGASGIGVSPAQEALQQAGEEVREALAELQSKALHAAASHAREWTDKAGGEVVGASS